MIRHFAVLVLVTLVVCQTSALCPTYVRLVNALVPSPTNLDVFINGQLTISGVPFRSTSRYSSIFPGVLQVTIQQSNSSTVVGTRTFTGVPNAAYTIAVTGPFTGPGGELLYNSSPFVFIENIFPPNQNTYKGTFHRLEESTATEDLEIVGPGGYFSGVSQVGEKTVAYYPEQIPGPVTFNVLTLSGALVNNSAGFPLTFNDSVSAGAVYDLFITGNDINNISPTELTSATYYPTLEPVSGCILVDGSTIYPDSTPFTPFYSFQPCPPLNSASSMAAGLAFLLLLVALLF